MMDFKAGDTVECIECWDDGQFGRVGERFKVLVAGSASVHLDGRLSGFRLTPSRFRKVAAEKPVYPFKAWDVVECLNADGSGVGLTEGRTYKVLDAKRTSSLNIDGWSGHVQVVTDGGFVRWKAAARFCAPGESRVALREKIKELEQKTKLADARPTYLELALGVAKKEIEELKLRNKNQSETFLYQARRIFDLEVELASRRMDPYQTMVNLPHGQESVASLVTKFELRERDLERARGEKLELETLNHKQAEKIANFESKVAQLEQVMTSLGIREISPGVFTCPVSK